MRRSAEHTDSKGSRAVHWIAVQWYEPPVDFPGTGLNNSVSHALGSRDMGRLSHRWPRAV